MGVTSEPELPLVMDASCSGPPALSVWSEQGWYVLKIKTYKPVIRPTTGSPLWSVQPPNNICCMWVLCWLTAVGEGKTWYSTSLSSSIVARLNSFHEVCRIRHLHQQLSARRPKNQAKHVLYPAELFRLSTGNLLCDSDIILIPPVGLLSTCHHTFLSRIQMNNKGTWDIGLKVRRVLLKSFFIFLPQTGICLESKGILFLFKTLQRF